MTTHSDLRELREDAETLLGELRYTERQRQRSEPVDAGAEVDRRVRALKAKEPGLSYGAAMHAVLDEDESLKVAYARQPFKASREESRRSAVRFSDGTQLERVSFRHDQGTPGDQIHAKVKALKAKDATLSYSQAYRDVLADPANAALKEAYAREGRR